MNNIKNNETTKLVTYVTGFINIRKIENNLDISNTYFTRVENYISEFKKLLNYDIYLVIYIDSSLYNEILELE